MLCGFCLRVKSESGSGLKKGWVDRVRMEAGVQQVGCLKEGMWDWLREYYAWDLGDSGAGESDLGRRAPVVKTGTGGWVQKLLQNGVRESLRLEVCWS